MKVLSGTCGFGLMDFLLGSTAMKRILVSALSHLSQEELLISSLGFQHLMLNKKTALDLAVKYFLHQAMSKVYDLMNLRSKGLQLIENMETFVPIQHQNKSF